KASLTTTSWTCTTCVMMSPIPRRGTSRFWRSGGFSSRSGWCLSDTALAVTRAAGLVSSRSTLRLRVGAAAVVAAAFVATGALAVWGPGHDHGDLRLVDAAGQAFVLTKSDDETQRPVVAA